MGTLVDGVSSKWIYAGDQYVAVASGRIDGDWDEVMANARLIAASPRLLEALEEAHEILHQCTAVLTASDTAKVAAVMARARAAIAAAK
jgi:hypothetical protein